MAVERIVNIIVNELGIDSAIDNTQRLEKGLDSVSGSSTNLAGGMKESTNSVLENGGAMGLLNDATGGLAMTVKDAVEATALFAKESKISTFIQGAYATVIGTSTGAMKAFKVALIGTGIGALVVGLILLITNFEKVKTAVYNLIPGLKDVGEFVGNIINAVTDFIGVTSEAERAFARLTEQADKSLAKNKKFLAEQGDQIDEFTKRKIEANNAYNEAIKEQGADVIALAKRQNREIAQIDADRNEARAKKRKEEQDKIDDENKRIADKAKQEREKQKAIDDKIAEDRKKLAEDNLKALNEFQIAVNNAEFEQRLIEEENLRLRLEAITNFEDEKARIEKEAKDKEIENAKTVQEAKSEIQDMTLNNVANGINLLSNLAGKSRALQVASIIADSAVGIAKVVINTKATNAGYRLKYALVPGGEAIAQGLILQNNIGAGIGIGANVLATAKALSALKSSGGSISPSLGSDGQASAPPQFNIVGQNTNNQLAQTIGSQQRQPIEAFVVSGNVTNAQQLDRNRINTATFGS